MTAHRAAKIFYRAFSDSSAGGLVSGKGKGSRRLSRDELLSEFENHKIRSQKQPTALISVTVSFIDVLCRAFSMLYKEHNDPDKIWIVFISVPDEDESLYHHAEDLAQKHKKPIQFKNEYLFEWEIPEKYIKHKVSVQTLLERGLNIERYLRYSKNGKLDLTTSALKKEIAEQILDPSNGGYEIGLSLGFIARNFGARALVCDIAHRILHECTRKLGIDTDTQHLRVLYWDGHNTTLDFEYFHWIDEGINEALIEMWLTDPGFCSAYEEHCEWVLRLEEEMERDWEIFREDVLHRDVSYREQLYQTLQAREDKNHKIRSKIEIAATKLGL